MDDYKATLSAIATSHVASEKINLVKDVLPSSLRPGNINPLGTLYAVLSEGIHSSSEDECLENADAIRSILVFLVHQIEESKLRRKQFTEAMQKVIGRKTGEVKKAL